MKTLKQLFRQPVKTLAGILLVTLAVAILCVCLGQALAAYNMSASLDQSYTTVALLTGKYQYREKLDGTMEISTTLPQDVADAVQTLLQDCSDIVLEDSYAGLASTYIPGLVPDSFTEYFTPPASAESLNYYLQSDPVGAPYTQALLRVRITAPDYNTPDFDIGTYWYQDNILCFYSSDSDGTEYSHNIPGVIEEVIGLSESYPDPTGFSITLRMTEETYQEIVPQEGETYLIRFSDYSDLDWELRACIAYGYGTTQYQDPYQIDPGRQQFGPQIDAFRDEDWNLVRRNDSRMPSWGENYAWYLHTYIDDNGEQVQRVVNINTLDNFCRVKHIQGTIQSPADMVAQEEVPEAWTDFQQEVTINSSAFPIIGVDNLQYISAFAQKTSTIVAGRDFTDQELADGSKVCILSQILAEKNGLSVGDTLTLQYYGGDNGGLSSGIGVVNPTAQSFDSSQGFSSEPVEYTIVGLYSMDNPRPDVNDDLYAFTPNTIFMPKTAVVGEMEYSNQGLFHSIILKNGAMNDFMHRVLVAGYHGLFECYDQGYTQILENLHDYTGIAQQAVEVGLAVYLVVLLLYLLLFPSRQGAAIATMASLGAEKREKRIHLLAGCLGVMVPGTVAGVALGIALRQQVTDALTSSADVVLPLEIDPATLIAIGMIQLVAAILLSLVVILPMSRNRSLIKGGRKRRWRLRANSWVVCCFSLLMGLVLCGLHAANEAEKASFAETRLTIPVEVSIQDLNGNDENTEIDSYIADLFYGEYSFGLTRYLKDIRVRTDQFITAIDGEVTDRTVVGITSASCAPELLPVTDGEITWLSGYDESVFATDELVCVAPEGTEAETLTLFFKNTVTKFDRYGNSYTEDVTCEFTLKVVGTYVSAYLIDAVYCPYSIVQTIQSRLQLATNGYPPVREVGGTLANNDQLEEFRDLAYTYFLDPDGNYDTKVYFPNYYLQIDTNALVKAQTMLQNSITINQISTLLVFVLSAGAGFFLGFLMIRSRKREIILMRTLGRANMAIYVQFAAEQMLKVIVGAAIGGAVFLWQPMTRLLLFAAVYFVGLTAALLLFLHTNLLSTLKEED